MRDSLHLWESKTITNWLKNKKTAHIAVIKRKILSHVTFFYFVEDEIGTQYQQTRFMTGKEIRNIEDRSVHDVYLDTYQDYVPRKQKIVNAAMKWKAPTNTPKEFKFSVNTNQSKSPEGVFMFGSVAWKSDRDKKLTAYTARIAKSPGICLKSSKSHQESKSLVQIWKTQGKN